MTIDEIVNEIERFEIRVSKSTVQRYVRQGLISEPDKKAAGRGRGSISDHSPKAAAEFVASWELIHRYGCKPKNVAAIRTVALKIAHEFRNPDDEDRVKLTALPTFFLERSVLEIFENALGFDLSLPWLWLSSLSVALVAQHSGAEAYDTSEGLDVVERILNKLLMRNTLREGAKKITSV